MRKEANNKRSSKHLNEIKNNDWIPITFGQVFKMQLGWLVCRIISLYCNKETKGDRNSFMILYLLNLALFSLIFTSCKCHLVYSLLYVKVENILESTNLQTISGLGLNLEASWDQNRGIEPRICTTELILPLHDPASSSRTICSVSTSLATLPQSFTPLFKYLIIQQR